MGTTFSELRSLVSGVERLGRNAAKRSELAWRYGPNLASTVAYRSGGAAPAGLGQRILAELNRDGIAIASASALVGAELCDELFEAAQQVERDRQEQLAASRAALLGPTRAQKPFVVPLLGDHPGLDAGSVFGRFALHPAILEVVNSYYEMYVSLRYYNIWHNLVTDRPPTQSQLWHRDPEDRYILKLFVTLGDVHDGHGPLTYATGTHPKGRYTTEPAYLHKDGDTTRSDDSQMAAVVPPSEWVKGVGPKGTLIFADTRGYHRGGLAREQERKVFLSEYTSRACGRGGISTAP